MLGWLKSKVEWGSQNGLQLVGWAIGFFLALVLSFTAWGAGLMIALKVVGAILMLTFFGLMVWLFTIPPHKRNIW